jgi:hypothetical protein
LDLRDARQFQQGLPASFPSWQTGSLKIDDSPVEMVAQFAIQTALQLFATEPSSSGALIENEVNRACQARPTVFFGGELLSSGSRQ